MLKWFQNVIFFLYNNQAADKCHISLLSWHLKNCRECHIFTPVRRKSMVVWNPPTVWWTVEWWWRSLTLAAIPYYHQGKVCKEWNVTTFLLKKKSLTSHVRYLGNSDTDQNINTWSHKRHSQVIPSPSPLSLSTSASWVKSPLLISFICVFLVSVRNRDKLTVEAEQGNKIQKVRLVRHLGNHLINLFLYINDWGSERLRDSPKKIKYKAEGPFPSSRCHSFICNNDKKW